MSEHSLTLRRVSAPPQRLTADERRASIIDAARAIFAERGYHGVSTADVAALAGCSEPLLYKLFRSKQGLFAAVLVDTAREMGRRYPDAIATSDDPLAAYGVRMREALEDPFMAKAVRLRSLAVALVDVPEIREAVVASVAMHRAKTAAVLEAAAARGQLRDGVDIDALAWLAVGASLVAGMRQALEGQDGLADMPRVHEALVGLARLDLATTGGDDR